MKKRFFAIAAMLFALAALCACDDKKEPAPEASAEAADLLVGVMPSMDYLPLAVAEREGYFEQVGLKIRLHKFYSANERDAAFQSGNIHGTVIDYTGALLQKAGGVELKLTSRCDAPFYIVGAKSSPVIDVADLKGAKVAVSRNTVIDYCVDMALQSAGLTPEDVEKVEINKIPVRYEMLRSGQVDATGLPYPLALLAAVSGDRIVTSNQQLGFGITGIMFSGRATLEKGEEIRKMYRAYNMGVEYIAGHGAEGLAELLKNEMGFNDETLKLTILSSYRKAELPDERDLEQVAAWLAGRKLIEPDFPVTELLDGQFLE